MMEETVMKSTHVLDLSQVALPLWWPIGGPVVLPLVKGEYGLAWDVVEGELPETFVKSLRSIIQIRDDHCYQAIAKKRPIGFSNRALPQGAVIREKQ